MYEQWDQEERLEKEHRTAERLGEIEAKVSRLAEIIDDRFFTGRIHTDVGIKVHYDRMDPLTLEQVQSWLGDRDVMRTLIERYRTVGWTVTPHEGGHYVGFGGADGYEPRSLEFSVRKEPTVPSPKPRRKSGSWLWLLLALALLAGSNLWRLFVK